MFRRCSVLLTLTLATMCVVTTQASGQTLKERIAAVRQKHAAQKQRDQKQKHGKARYGQPQGQRDGRGGNPGRHPVATNLDRDRLVDAKRGKPGDEMGPVGHGRQGATPLDP